MTINETIQTPFLRSSRHFSQDIPQLTLDVDKAYLEIANAVNFRTIGIFPTNKNMVTGNNYYVTSKRQQSLRQIYTFTTTTAIPLGFDTKYIPYFSQMTGYYTDGTNWYGLIAGSNVAIAGQRSFFITGTPTNQITFLAGAGAPALTSGMIVLEWLSVP